MSVADLESSESSWDAALSSQLESEELGQSRAGQTLRLLPQTHSWWSGPGLGPCISNPLPGDELPLVQGPHFV